ncbi:MAG: CFI-box-CTERM domain-containing protein [Pseudomonadota bacterium]
MLVIIFSILSIRFINTIINIQIIFGFFSLDVLLDAIMYAFENNRRRFIAGLAALCSTVAVPTNSRFQMQCRAQRLHEPGPFPGISLTKTWAVSWIHGEKVTDLLTRATIKRRSVKIYKGWKRASPEFDLTIGETKRINYRTRYFVRVSIKNNDKKDLVKILKNYVIKTVILKKDQRNPIILNSAKISLFKREAICDYELDPSLSFNNMPGSIVVLIYKKQGEKLELHLSGEFFPIIIRRSWELAELEGKRLTTAMSNGECLQEGEPEMVTRCFLTTAAVDQIGLDDDCWELETLRRFRDDWLVHQPGGAEDIQTYYEQAPYIAEQLRAQPAELLKLYWLFIVPSALAAQFGFKRTARRLYTRMMDWAKRRVAEASDELRRFA